MAKTSKPMVETTLGDLIAAASEVAFEYSDNDREAYDLAQMALVELLRKTSHNDMTGKLEDYYAPSELSH